METFRINRSFRFHRIMACGYPVILLVSIVSSWLIFYDSSTVRLKYEDYLPVLAIASILWFCYELWRTITDWRFTVAISEESVRVGRVTKQWVDITRAEIRLAVGREPAIILHGEDGSQLVIPAIMDGIEYIQTIIEKRISNIEKEE